ncbi:CBS domain-containing protein [Paenibacillus daejeonensis]|uniref:CBS domain-containing protein n=1 Tax=Paenibacillus daejeonensis TaxID=135193 RepID=UPI00035C6F4E|nr:CBS domain-containing protein [Paenibacillus daejeonensis]
MQISSFLLPKEKVTYVLASDSMAVAMHKLEHQKYTAIPIIDDEGKYIGTLSEGDLLWKMKDTPGLTFETMEQVPVSKMRKRVFNESVVIDAHMEDMLTLAADQNFVPVTDHHGVFLGIIRRKDIIEYYTRNITD